MDWVRTIIELLEGTTFDVPRRRLGWTAISALYSLFLEASTEGKREMLLAMALLIERAIQTRDEGDWRLAANLIYLCSNLGSTNERLDVAISKINHAKGPTEESDEAVRYSSEVYRAAKRIERPAPRYYDEEERNGESGPQERPDWKERDRE